MGGIFGKNKRPCVFPRVVYRARGRKAAGAARVCCDAATWTGENHCQSARIGRALRGSEPPAARVVMETSGIEWKEGSGGSAASPRAQHSTAPPEEPQEHGDEPFTEGMMEHQELPEEPQGAPNPEESSEAEAVLHTPGRSVPPELGSGDQGVTPLPLTTVEVDVHVSAGDHGDSGQGQAAAEPELLSGAEQQAGSEEEGGRVAAEEGCVGKALWEVPEHRTGDSTAPSCPLEEPQLPLEAPEPGEDTPSGQGSAQELRGGAAEALPDLQPGQEAPVAEGGKESALAAERAEEMAQACGDGQTAEEIPAGLAGAQTALQEEKIQVSSEGKAEEH